MIYLAFLAPDIVQRMAEGRQPPKLGCRTLLAAVPLPLDWDEQRRVLGFSTRADLAPLTRRADGALGEESHTNQIPRSRKVRDRNDAAENRAPFREHCPMAARMETVLRRLSPHRAGLANKKATAWGWPWNSGGADGARTRDPRRDRPVF